MRSVYPELWPFKTLLCVQKGNSKKNTFGDIEGLTKEKSQLPNKSDMLAPTAEVLRQTAGAGIERGGWAGGDAWFGSVQAVVELKKRLDVFSTFVVKNNKQFYPMEALHVVMKARHG